MSGLSNLDQNALKTLENLKQFEAFFKMIQNPNTYAEIVTDAKNTLENIKAATEPYNTVKLAEEYLEKSKAFAAELTDKSIKEEQEAKARAQAIITDAKQQKQDADSYKQQAIVELKEVESLKEMYQKRVENIDTIKQDLSVRLQNLSLREAACSAKEQELELKANKLKEIMGV